MQAGARGDWGAESRKCGEKEASKNKYFSRERAKGGCAEELEGKEGQRAIETEGQGRGEAERECLGETHTARVEAWTHAPDSAYLDAQRQTELESDGDKDLVGGLQFRV